MVSVFFSVFGCLGVHIFESLQWGLLLEPYSSNPGGANLMPREIETSMTSNYLRIKWPSDLKWSEVYQLHEQQFHRRLSLHYMPLPLRLLYPWIISMAPRKLVLVPPSMRHGWHGLCLKARGEWYRCSMNHYSNRLTRLAKFLQMSVSQIFHTNVASEFQNQNVLNDRQKSLGWRVAVPPFLCTFRGANFAHWQACPMASGGNPGPID